ncbi:MAG: disulfide bond formation protein B [Granulosicoccus sp.]|nr:disulfide bond formation protein B [Granulosicoccus sp.]
MNFSTVHSRRLVWAGSLTAVVGLMSYAIYAERVLYLDPCPLCITQRLFYIGIGCFALIGLLSVRRLRMQQIAAGLMALMATGGLVTAGRQVWLQHLPADKVPECGPGLAYWMENEPWLRTLSLLFKGDGNCAEVVWTFLGFSMGEWSFAWFVLFFVVALVMLFKQRHVRA